jgi:hypothetical protein
MFPIIRSSLLLQIALLLSGPICAQEPPDAGRVAITGTVVNSLTGDPVDGAELTITELGLSLRSDSQGTFRFADLPLGSYWLSITAPGFRKAEGRFRVERAGSFTLRLDPLDSAGAGQPGQVRGVVRDDSSGNPLETALVSLPGLSLTTITNSRGQFSFPEVPAGVHLIRTEHLGFSARADSIEVPAGHLLTLEVRLGIQPIELAPINVSVERRLLSLDLAGFYDRRQAGQGVFLTREDIEAKLPFYSTDIFESLPGIRVVGAGALERGVLLRAGLRPSATSDGVCAPALWVDGILVAQAGPFVSGLSPGESGEGASVDRFVRPSEIAGVAAYTSVATTPLQYRNPGGLDCGVIVIWTR